MPIPLTPSAITRTCLRDAAYERLRDWILDGTLAPEEPLRDEALAEALGMSRTPVREALQRLEDDGLVITTATRRSYVSPLSLQQARDVFPLVATLEALAVRLALPQLDTATLDSMCAANAHLAEALRAGDAGAALEADLALHGAIVACSGNRELVRVLDELKCTVRRIERAFWGAADRMASVRDHEELIAALTNRDLRTAERVLARNWERGLAWINPEHAEAAAAVDR